MPISVVKNTKCNQWTLVYILLRNNKKNKNNLGFFSDCIRKERVYCNKSTVKNEKFVIIVLSSISCVTPPEDSFWWTQNLSLSHILPHRFSVKDESLGKGCSFILGGLSQKTHQSDFKSQSDLFTAFSRASQSQTSVSFSLCPGFSCFTFTAHSIIRSSLPSPKVCFDTGWRGAIIIIIIIIWCPLKVKWHWFNTGSWFQSFCLKPLSPNSKVQAAESTLWKFNEN